MIYSKSEVQLQKLVFELLRHEQMDLIRKPESPTLIIEQVRKMLHYEDLISFFLIHARAWRESSHAAQGFFSIYTSTISYAHPKWTHWRLFIGSYIVVCFRPDIVNCSKLRWSDRSALHLCSAPHRTVPKKKDGWCMGLCIYSIHY